MHRVGNDDDDDEGENDENGGDWKEAWTTICDLRYSLGYIYMCVKESMAPIHVVGGWWWYIVNRHVVHRVSCVVWCHGAGHADPWAKFFKL